ncbi:MAG: hypothetical protein AB7G68_16195 [Nitrospiraceae bacterium]|jgi:hypothetical protein
MAKKTKTESDEARLKKKISMGRKEHASGDASFRELKKRLKRLQRKRRAMVARKGRAAGKGAEGKSETAG